MKCALNFSIAPRWREIIFAGLVSAVAMMASLASPLRAANVPPSSAEVPSAARTKGDSTFARDNASSRRTEQYTLSHDRWQKAVAYSRAGYTLYFVSYFVIVLGLLLVLRTGLVSRLRDFAERASEKRWLQGLIFVPLLVLLVDLFELPVRLYWHALSLHYEQSVEGWAAWSWDWTKEELLQMLISAILGLILFAMLRRSPRRWWFYFWLAMLPIALLLTTASPYIIDPLFNHFQPLATDYPEMVASIESLTQHAGIPIPPERMFLMEASKKTNTLNAYVAGLGPSKRVVIYDTTIEKMTPNGALFIVGHELGHYVLGHIWQGFLFFAVGLFFALYLIFRGLHWVLERWGRDWRLDGPQDWASLAVLLLLLELLTFFASPIINGLSRMEEHAADVYGLEVIHGVVPDSEEVAAHAFQVLGEIDLSDPNPPAFITFWLYSHPPLAQRLVFAHNYDPWSRGQSPKYVK
ncbi:MAG: M48 family metallopeptidase [Candidatus Acidiferrum sp.]|jgi:Zn-dependent protease with chaperone function